ncbi:hypothetical protein C8J57DRAFT_1535534 [Mycena rebaudengoi]|nr:hypothetical protein C8J57DRAFT_1535534 [Mycena rebaudengoi]
MLIYVKVIGGGRVAELSFCIGRGTLPTPIGCPATAYVTYIPVSTANDAQLNYSQRYPGQTRRTPSSPHPQTAMGRSAMQSTHRPCGHWSTPPTRVRRLLLLGAVLALSSTALICYSLRGSGREWWADILVSPFELSDFP